MKAIKGIDVQGAAFELPEVVNRELIPKREAAKPDITVLKEQQMEGYLKMLDFLDTLEGGWFLLKGYAGTGKAQPLTAKIYTPEGYKLMGDIEVGDVILNARGGVQTVLGVHPQGVKKLYRVHFSDGTYIDCCGEHLWQTYTYSDRNCNRVSRYKRRNKIKHSVSTTVDIMNSLYNVRGGLNHKMPTAKPVAFVKNHNPIDPYIMGVLLGDGSLTGSTVTVVTSDKFIVDKIVERLPSGFTIEKVKSGKYEYNIKSNGGWGSHYIRKYLQSVGLCCKSDSKYIPQSYIYSDYQDRIDLLHGLMDSDGTADSRGYSDTFCTTSAALKDGFCELVRSLGGVASCTVKKGGEYLDSYVVTVNMPKNIPPFSLPRKSVISTPKTKYETSLFIVDVEDLGVSEKQQCITVSSEDKLYLTDGFKVTHNTFLISRVIETYLHEHPANNRIAVTAPTNKAVKELYTSSEFTHPNMAFATIHSLLGLKEHKTFDGGITFKPDFKKPAEIATKSVLIIDEVSMLSDELFKFIEPYVMKGLKVIMMGDPAQIPPIGKDSCLPLSEDGQKDYGIQVIELTDILRQKQGNPIIETTFKIRNRINSPVVLAAKETELLEDGSGVVYIPRGEEFAELLHRYFTSDNFKMDANFAKVIAWRNKTIDGINNIIRQMIYDKDSLPRIMEGEKLIANTPIFEDETIIFNTNAEMEVVSYEVKEDLINDGAVVLKYYLTLVKFTDVNNEYRERYIRIVHGDSMQKFEDILEAIRLSALSKPKGSYEQIKAWEDFYLFKQRYADINYNYAITAHKAQGSTYDRVFVLEADIDANRKVTERNKIKYTAASRARHQLFVIS